MTNNVYLTRKDIYNKNSTTVAAFDWMQEQIERMQAECARMRDLYILLHNRLYSDDISEKNYYEILGKFFAEPEKDICEIFDEVLDS